MTRELAALPGVALTGATGFVGGATARALRAAGVAVRALVRRPEAVAGLAQLGVTPQAGDLERPATLRGFAIPNGVVVHAAALVDVQARWAEHERVTIRGTAHLLDAVLPRDAGLRPSRFVYISSGGVYAAPCPAQGYCADRPGPGPATYNLYGRAKLAAEELVRSRCAEAGVEWVILRIGFLYGPGNRALHSALRPQMVRRRAAFVGDGSNRIAALHIDDAVAAIVRAVAHPAARERVYDVANAEPVSQRDFLCGHAEAFGAPLPWRSIRFDRALALAGLLERFYGWFGARPAINRAAVELLGSDQRIDCSAIERELGWRARVRFADGIARLRSQLAEEAGRGRPALE